LFRIFPRVLLLLAGLALLPFDAWSQAAISPDAAATVEMLQTRVQKIEASKDPARTPLLEFYRKSIGLIEHRRNHEAATQEFIKARELAPQESAKLRKQLVKLETREPEKLLDSLVHEALPKLERKLLSEKADLAGLTGTLAELEASLETQAQRPQQVRDRLNESRKRQAQVQENLKSLTADGKTPRLIEARRWALEHELRALNGETEMLNRELLGQPTRIE
jgi:chromosome segregation ATPase